MVAQRGSRRPRELRGNRWEAKLRQPIRRLERGMLTMTVEDPQGNTARIERVFSVK